ncbi:hypothetical protein NUV25_11815 [Burkholderia pseudomultivorans]|uniref:Uncharacterized protein n=1 Tax=Burkholderia pseudomultivorans TaxID=1207504 RepID=A0A132F3W7_9BURK|nr:hypothetical protein [Burkholderia pseudomultivorans]KWF68425.1 hypothetical protein WT57_13215 [Burkholderia pseudomultivorans]MDS0858396.1 hypothetical protein [Burkholderia pseudomultivorans]
MPLIYVIPESYVGPVVALFDQPDGVEPVHTQDGLEVRVPENGIVKIRGNPKLGHSRAFPKSTVVFEREKGDGSREVLQEAIDPWQDYDQNDNPHWKVGIRDAQGNLRTIAVSDQKQGFVFDDFPDADKNKVMIFWHESCQDRVFGPESEAYLAGEKSAEDLHVPPCGEFVVGAFNHIRDWPEWMFLRGKGKQEKSGIRNPTYSSIQELVDEANARAARKKTEDIE